MTQTATATANAPGRSLLKVTGILMVIFGSFNLIFTLVGMLALGAIGGALGGAAGAAVGIGAVLIGSISGIVQFVTGIMGILNANKPEKAMVCMVFGALMIVFVLVNLFTNFSGFAIFGAIIGLVLPVLYIMGALKNKQVAG